MTQSTRSRQLMLLIRGILNRHGITDGLDLEMELCQACKSLYDPPKKGQTPAELRAEIEKALAEGAAVQTRREAAMERAEKALKRIAYNLNGAPLYEQERLYKHLTEAEKHGETIEKFVSWAAADPWWHDKISSIQKIIEIWPRAFTEKSNIIKADGGGFYA